MSYSRWFLVCGAALVRLAIGLGSYSGAGVPPKYGDYEAQRHWMEITVNLPTNQWYRNSTDNDVSHWGLDYPPLSGYQSWLHGKIVQQFEPAAVELKASRGYETHFSKLLLRWSVVLSDLIVFFPAALWASNVISEETGLMLLMQPGLMLIDHGHFQYNCISLGFVLGAILCIDQGRHLLGSAAFICGMNHKHMSLYFAFAFFAHLLGRCFEQRTHKDKILKFVGLGMTVIGTMGIIWLPYLTNISSVLEVCHRLMPVARGLYEDYVSNFWCISSVVIKWKQRLQRVYLVRLCTGLTLVACLPSMVHQIRQPTTTGFHYGLTNTSLAFYLFSYQVHEKSILMPALASTLLLNKEATLVQSFHLMSCFSMFPLLEKDGIALQYFAVILIFLSIPLRCSQDNSLWTSRLLLLLIVSCTVLHCMRWTVQPPFKYPYLHDLLFSGLSFGFFFVSFVYLNWRQWRSKS